MDYSRGCPSKLAVVRSLPCIQEKAQRWWPVQKVGIMTVVLSPWVLLGVRGVEPLAEPIWSIWDRPFPCPSPPWVFRRSHCCGKCDTGLEREGGGARLALGVHLWMRDWSFPRALLVLILVHLCPIQNATPYSPSRRNGTEPT